MDSFRSLARRREGWAREKGRRASAACALAATGNPRCCGAMPILSRSSCPWSLPTRPRPQQNIHCAAAIGQEFEPDYSNIGLDG